MILTSRTGLDKKGGIRHILLFIHEFNRKYFDTGNHIPELVNISKIFIFPGRCKNRKSRETWW